jgi:anti-sigma B factor antagonist
MMTPLNETKAAHASPVSSRITCGHAPGGDTTSIVRLRGDIDWSNSLGLSADISEVLTNDHPARLLLDLEGVERVDSSGVGALLASLNEANRKHVRLTLSGLSNSLRSLLERTKLLALFEVRPSLQDALLT